MISSDAVENKETFKEYKDFERIDRKLLEVQDQVQRLISTAETMR